MKPALVLALLIGTPAAAQHRHGHDMPVAPAANPPVVAPASARATTSVAGTDLPAGDASAPPPPADHYADRDYAPTAMADARATMMREEGGRLFHQILFNLAEVQARDGTRDGLRWDGQAWFGGDIDRLTLRSEGRSNFRGGTEDAELQALWSHAIGPYFNLQAGARQEFEPGPRRTSATIGIEGLAPYWFQTEARLFLTTHGELSGRLEGWVDQRLTQRLVLQPRVELNLAAQDTRSRGIGAGLSDAELGLRLRYEIVREFAPYVGLTYDVRTGATARYARAAGEKPRVVGLVSGVRFWF